LKTTNWAELLLGKADANIRRSLTLKDIQVFFDLGDHVGFVDNLGCLKTGYVKKLNPKYARVSCDDGNWQVPYLRLNHLCTIKATERQKRGEKLRKVAEIAQEKMNHYGLNEWRLGFSTATTKLGCCRYSQKKIELSLFHTVSSDDDQIMDTILHEIAHALAGPSAGHGPKWKQIAQQIGATPKSCAPASEEALQKAEIAKSHFKVGDYVTFSAQGYKLVGQIFRMNTKRATVHNQDGKWLVPYLTMQKYDAQSHAVNSSLKRPSGENSKMKFRVGDSVSFGARGKSHLGIIIKMNPKCAKVKCRDNTLWTVDYRLLKS